MNAPLANIGTTRPRIDADLKITGAARYAADFVLPHMLHAKVLRSPHAHARVVSVDATRARMLPGVFVVTRDDLGGLNPTYGYFIKDQPIAFRAPKLRQRILDLSSAPLEASFIDELVARDLPLFLLRKPGSDALETRAFGNVNALPAYVDVIGLHWAAADLKLAPGSYAPGPADPRPLLEHIAQGGLGLAIGTFRDRATASA